MNNDYLHETEKQIIGGILYFGTSDTYCQYAINNLSEDDFAVPVYKLSFQYIKSSHGKNEKLDKIELLKATGMSNELFTDMLTCCSTSSTFKSYVKLLQQRTADNRIISGIASISKADDKFAALEKLYLSEKEQQNNQHKNIGERTREQYLDFLKYINTPLTDSDRIYTGFPGIDACIGGFRKQSISVIGAYPSTGKTTLALNIARNQIKKKNETLFFSLEMSCNQIYERLAADILSINYHKLGVRDLTDEEKAKIGKLVDYLAKENVLHIRDDVVYIEDITREISILRPAFVVIDFIQRIKTHERTNSRREEIDRISSEIKTAAKIYDCHIMTLSQLARKSDGHKPTMDDLKESSGLTENNDYIMLLYRPNVSDKSKPGYEAQLTIDKNKYGDTGLKDMNFNGGMQRFTEVQKYA